ncbi:MULTISPECIES: hypothetical protein [Roseiflexus]|jgi:hypothetical protein|uniref:Uncharacterized protein n=2 Tax=Roseiflexus castenholzii TaxID=120962 RepID=A7NMI9_ROSCS|nr:MULTISPECIES: hypothetical protein [Roseiflexus]ABU58751.1 hypothetical protein Rcas_2680 [Roseiflexus castenholzii DSM 13941]GIW01732.1 MAG: hypothetical protein KatS3mg058_3135 [Roseiflexus sp.]
MVWCLAIPACLAAVLALATLFAPPPRIILPSPGHIARGCVATALMLVAAALMGLAVLLQEAQ